MSSVENDVLQGTQEAMAMLRARGGCGETLSELAENLARRRNLPKSVKRACDSVHVVYTRVRQNSAPLSAVEMSEWARGVSTIVRWTKRDVAAEQTPSDSVVTTSSPRKGATPPDWQGARVPARKPVEPWMVVVLVVAVVAFVGGLTHLQGLTRRSEQMTVDQAFAGIYPSKR